MNEKLYYVVESNPFILHHTHCALAENSSFVRNRHLFYQPGYSKSLVIDLKWWIKKEFCGLEIEKSFDSYKWSFLFLFFIFCLLITCVSYTLICLNMLYHLHIYVIRFNIDLWWFLFYFYVVLFDFTYMNIKTDNFFSKGQLYGNIIHVLLWFLEIVYYLLIKPFTMKLIYWLLHRNFWLIIQLQTTIH